MENENVWSLDKQHTYKFKRMRGTCDGLLAGLCQIKFGLTNCVV